MTPSWRKPAGALGILAYLTAWIVVIASFSRVVGSLPALVQALIYLIAGIIWILPLGPALRWMETGRWRG
ncbi:Protein of unknown function [Sphingomonas guangdongensis]|uniref:DUF2842 domain-containing protein n=1 Tax=Sphingomonas guangdongensis TaxID=1141890 RepID=A0A285R0X5_9SPHN|nr:DUF2842 domain-containing protein [Sphingomonas guangdongensis]SOB87776.1 Protein of unknown function [Sphingomonas guangdongensis]